METKKINDRFSFVNESKGNRSGFYHRSVLLENGCHLWEEKTQYYNRTWESYQFQSSMRNCLYSLIESEKKDVLDSFRSQSGKTRLKQSEKDELISGSERIKQLTELLNQL